MATVADGARPIDWARLAAAMSFYTARGYRSIEVPWMVSRQTTSVTCSDASRLMPVEGMGDLVGSAEQSFLALEQARQLGRGRFVACSPCFRNEPYVDQLHRRCFMKVELYVNVDVGSRALDSVLADAWSFMQTQVSYPSDLHRVPTADGWDIELGTVEVGSYGLRSHAGTGWVYGTGVAEPRFSDALHLLDEASQ